jgi:hypothetical protein
VADGSDVEPDQLEAAGDENRRQLKAFVAAVLRRCAREEPNNPAPLQANATVLRRHLVALQRPGPTPVHLVGLTAFDLSDAADELEAAATQLILCGPAGRIIPADPPDAPRPLLQRVDSDLR